MADVDRSGWGPALLSLANRGLKLDTAADVELQITSLIEIAGREQIQWLNLSGNTIGVEAAKALAPQLSTLTNLEDANLADIFTSRLLSEIPPALDALLEALLQCKKLTKVNLSDNAFGLNTQAPLVRFLERHTPLKHLILNNNGLGPEAGTLVSNALTRLASAKEKGTDMLETIVCGRNRLENGSSAGWAEALNAHSSHLKEVRMSQNGIRMEGTQAILRQGLRNAKHLEVLDLQDNLFTVSAAQALAEVIPGWEQLKDLQIADTLLRARGGVLLGEALAKGSNKKLQTLRLQYNEVDIKGVQAFLNAAKKECLPELRRVELNGNKFAEEDPAVDELKELLEDRKQKAGVEEDDEEWGLDELDELEDESDEEEDDNSGDESEGEDEDIREKDVKMAKEAEEENVAQEKDADVDALADKLNKTEI